MWKSELNTRKSFTTNIQKTSLKLCVKSTTEDSDLNKNEKIIPGCPLSGKVREFSVKFPDIPWLSLTREWASWIILGLSRYVQIVMNYLFIWEWYIQAWCNRHHKVVELIQESIEHNLASFTSCIFTYIWG